MALEKVDLGMRSWKNDRFNVATCFYEVVRTNSANAAIRYVDNIISYGDLNVLSNKIANYFQSLNIRAYDVVGIFNTKGVTGYATMLACLKLGITYTNIDEENPLSRIESIINCCNPKLLVSDHKPSEAVKKAAKTANIKLVDFGSDELFVDLCGENLEISNNIIGSAPAYIMFTSGSTGIPKGVTISHDNLLSFIKWSINRFDIRPDDKFAQLSPMYFDNSVFDFYTALFSGASLVPITKLTAKKPLEVVELVDRLKCTIWFSVPTFLVYLLTMRVLTKDTFESIRIFIFGGEGFPKGELKKLYNLYSDKAKLVNVYGPTEGTCICSTYNVSEKDFIDMNSLAPIGTINPNFEYMIVDKNFEGVKKGEKGELCLVGPNVALGYYNDYARTSESFVQNPIIKTHKNVVYRCGDVVYEQDGLLWFAGRADNQIKHMGYRIELEEIESALNGLKYINQSAVVYERVKVNYGKIIAFVVAAERHVTEAQIKMHLEQFLPKYMIPAIIIMTGALPKNANGKIDRKLLMKSYNDDK
ncbi:amino acid adenylation domain-containing protein [bacterium]|nr:amino acid adenylation domain-containing protein [bacterium]